MFNGTNIGYKKGLEDGLNGLSAQPNKQLPKLKAILSEKFVRTFLESYKQGHKEGTWELNKRKRAQMKTNHSKTSTKQSVLKSLIDRCKQKIIDKSKSNQKRKNYEY